MKLILKILLIGLMILLFSGCAVNRGEVYLQTPQEEQLAQSNGYSVFINSVNDNRVFEVKPRNQSIHSLKPNEKNDASIKARAIARKRNGFGAALGDILLKEGQTVSSVVKSSTEQAFLENGYELIDDKSQVTDKTLIVHIDINKFWSWMNPGFWAITLSSEISTDLTIKDLSQSKSEVISVKYADSFQAASESNWIEVMQKTLKLYISELKQKLN